MSVTKIVAMLSGCDASDVQYGEGALSSNSVFPPSAAYDLQGFCAGVTLDTLPRLVALSLHTIPVIEIDFSKGDGNDSSPDGDSGADDSDSDNASDDSSDLDAFDMPETEDSHWHVILSSSTRSPQIATRTEIGEIAMLDKSGLDNLFLKCVPLNILRPDWSGHWYINDDFFLRGTKPTSGSWQYVRVRKVKKDTFLQLYKKGTGNLKYIGAVLRLTPNLNCEHNYLCYNPDETRSNEIVPLAAQDICRVLGYEPRRASYYIDKLKEKFLGITFKHDGVEQQLCRIDKDGNNYLVMVNPNVIYADGPSEYKRICLELYWGYPDPFDAPFRRYPYHHIKGSTLDYVNRAN